MIVKNLIFSGFDKLKSATGLSKMCEIVSKVSTWCVIVFFLSYHFVSRSLQDQLRSTVTAAVEEKNLMIDSKKEITCT